MKGRCSRLLLNKIKDHASGTLREHLPVGAVPALPRFHGTVAYTQRASSVSRGLDLCKGLRSLNGTLSDGNLGPLSVMRDAGLRMIFRTSSWDPES